MADKPRWMAIAEAEIGQKEVAGAAANPRIVEYFAATTFPATSDEIPWCSAFPNWVLKQVGIVGSRSAAAVSWADWGVACDGRDGAIVVIQRRQPLKPGADPATGSRSGFHVGFWRGQTEDAVLLLGGNQGDAVCEAWFRLRSYRIVAVRWPALEPR